MDMKNFEEQIITDIETAAQKAATDTIIIDNLTYLCNSSEKGDQAGIFMMKLMNLKMKYNWSLLVIAHTPKRNMTNPITQNDLAGSKKLYNFFDSVFAIGKSAADPKLRYVKQVKVRAGEYRYDADNVIVYEIEHETDNVRFAFKGFAKESEHLKEQTEEEKISLNQQAHELRKEGKSIREIAAQLGMSKSTVDRMLKSVPPVPPQNDGTSGTNGTKDKSNVKPKEDETLF
jgi:DNA-binding CsgD family transcriptional regulator